MLKKIVYAVSFSLLVLIFITLLIFVRDSSRIVEIREFINTGRKVVYVMEGDEPDYIVDLLEKYNIDYIHVNSSKLNVFERKKIKEIIDSNNLKRTLVFYEGGKIKQTLTKISDQEEIIEILQEYNILPEQIVDNVEDIMNDASSILESEYSMVYIPYKESEELEEQNEIFEEISLKYSIEYKKIDAYLLSSNQQEKINKLLGLSLVEDQILILIKDNKMVANIRGIHRKNTYIESLYSANFIDELENKINTINYDEFEEKLKESNKNIILIGSDNSKDSNDVFELLNKMIYNYNIEVNYINIDNEDSITYNKIKEKLEDIKYDGSFSLPIVVIIESNNILDYAIGNSKEDYFVDIFIENGVIKGDVINE